MENTESKQGERIGFFVGSDFGNWLDLQQTETFSGESYEWYLNWPNWSRYDRTSELIIKCFNLEEDITRV